LYSCASPPRIQASAAAKGKAGGARFQTNHVRILVIQVGAILDECAMTGTFLLSLPGAVLWASDSDDLIDIFKPLI